MIRSPLPGMPPWHCVSHQTCAQQRRIHQMDNRNGRYWNRKGRCTLHQQPEKTGVKGGSDGHIVPVIRSSPTHQRGFAPPYASEHTWTVPVITLLLLLGLVAGAVIMSTVTRRHVQLDDGTVWVTSLKNQKAARFNVKNKEADAGVSSSAPRFDIAQHNGDTILTETTKASTIKASTVSTGVKTDIKANTTTVVGGDTAA